MVAAAAAAVIVAVPIAGFAIRNASVRTPSNQSAVGVSCAAPQLHLVEVGNVSPSVVGPGDEITVSGRFSMDGCDDTNPQLGPTPKPELVRLSRRHGTHVAQLGSVQAHGELGTFRTTIRIPAGFPLGHATLVSDPPSYRRGIQLDIGKP